MDTSDSTVWWGHAEMQAAIYSGHGQGIVIEDLPDPKPGPEDLIIKVHRCGICGTDLSMTKGGQWDFGVNTQFGHEYAGEIIELGERVAGFRIGERVGVCPRRHAAAAKPVAVTVTMCYAKTSRVRPWRDLRSSRACRRGSRSNYRARCRWPMAR